MLTTYLFDLRILSSTSLFPLLSAYIVDDLQGASLPCLIASGMFESWVLKGKFLEG